MPTTERDYLSEFTEFDRLRVRIALIDGAVTSFTVQYETLIDDRWYPVVRYDNAHGRGHRDTLNARGETTAKDWLPDHVNHQDALTTAQNDLRINWERYRSTFLERVG